MPKLSLRYLVLASVLLNAFALGAIEFECTKPKWSMGPTVKSNVFEGTVDGECLFRNVSAVDWKSMQDLFEAQTKEEAMTIHSGPEEATFEAAPAVHYDITALQKAKGDQAKIRSDVFLQTDLATRATIATISKNIVGEGFAAKLRRVNSRVGFTAMKRDEAYRLLIQVTVEIGKPTLVTPDLFKKLAMQNLEEEMTTRQRQEADAISEHLGD